MSNINYKRIIEESDQNEDPYALRATTLSLESNHSLNILARLRDERQRSSSGDVQLLSSYIDDSQTLPSTIYSVTTAERLPGEGDDTIDEDDLLSNGEGRKKKPLCNRLKGILSILFATSLVALNNEILYYLYDKLRIPYSKSLYLTWACIIYSVQNVIPLMFTMYKSTESVFQPIKDDRKIALLLVLRGLMGSSIQFLTSHAIDRFGKPAPVSVITAIAPIFVYINAYFVLKEALGVIPLLNVFVAIAGVVVMNLNELGQTHDYKTLEGTGFALGCMFLLSWITVVIRFLRGVNPWLINLAFGLGGIVVQGLIVLCENSKFYIDDLLVIGFCLTTATLTTVGNFFYNVSLKYESAGVVSLMRTTEVVFSFLFQFCLFGIQPDRYTSIGGGMVLFGVICVTLRKIVQESSETSKLRRYLWFLLY